MNTYPGKLDFLRGLLGVLRWFPIAVAVASASAADSARSADIEVRGKLICVPEFMHETYGAALPTGHTHIVGLHSDQDTVYVLLRTPLSEALFTDSALKEKHLLLKGGLYPESLVLDVAIVRSVRDGKIYDLYYWCDICAIKSVIPGTCMCCQEDVVLKEEPLEP